MLERDAALEELKVYGRDPKNADPIFTKEVSRPDCSRRTSEEK